MAFDLAGKRGLWIHETAKAIGHLHEIQALGFDYLCVKIADGERPYFPAEAKQLCADADTINLPVVAWAYVYPKNIINTIATISANIPKGCQHLVLDAEAEWESPDGDTYNKENLASLLCHGIASSTNHAVQLWLSSFVNPSAHNLPYAAFLAHCSGFMPQAYAEGNTPLSTVIARLKSESLPMAQKSLGKSLIPTINTPELVPLISGIAPTHGFNVWLYDGVQLAPGVPRPAGDDMGVAGYEKQWQKVLAKTK